ncbi:hypothetical protein [Nocardioides terrisoli]|uniref:hypothetical protein n=1 Tax=Nocardioides terrisoli TaxID=3388267 RepID=UPI00287B8771|nr:hypothetical protein [Nocardioides marmorisolisilvae]
MGTTRARLGAAVAAAALLTTAACGGGSGSSRPSTADLSKSIRSTGDNSVLGSQASQLTKAAADCIAKALHDSKISDTALRAIVKGNKDYKASSADQKAATAVLPQLEKCATAAQK